MPCTEPWIEAEQAGLCWGWLALLRSSVVLVGANLSCPLVDKVINCRINISDQLSIIDGRALLLRTVFSSCVKLRQ